MIYALAYSFFPVFRNGPGPEEADKKASGSIERAGFRQTGRLGCWWQCIRIHKFIKRIKKYIFILNFKSINSHCAIPILDSAQTRVAPMRVAATAAG
jgi:hypothetical protein